MAATASVRESQGSAPVVVVGAGPAGATLAYLLASRGIEVTLLERQQDFAREFRGEVVMPSGMAVFDAAGLGSALARVPQSTVSRFTAYVDRRQVADGSVDSDFFHEGLPVALSQPALLEALVAEGEKLPTFHFERGVTVEDLVQEGERVVGVRAQTDDGMRMIPARLVIGTDGRGSLVRKSAALPLRDRPLPMDVLWFKVPELPGASPEDAWVRAYAGGGHLLIAYVTHDGCIQIAWVIFKGSFNELRQHGLDKWIDAMVNHVSPDLGAHIRAHRDRVIHPFLLATASDRVSPWWKPGVLVLGDAAHTMSPVGAQGINVALRDTVVAANHLVPLLRDPQGIRSLDAACAAIEAERRPELDRIQWLQSLPPRIILGTSWWAQGLRRLAPWLVSRGPVQAQLLREAGPFFRGVTEVRLRV